MIVIDVAHQMVMMKEMVVFDEILNDNM